MSAFLHLNWNNASLLSVEMVLIVEQTQLICMKFSSYLIWVLACDLFKSRNMPVSFFLEENTAKNIT